MSSDQSESSLVWRNRIDRNRVYIERNLEPDELIQPLAERGVLPPTQRDEMDDMPKHLKKQKLIDVVYRGPQALFEAFVEELRKDLQHAVADRLTTNPDTVHIITGKREIIQDMACLHKGRHGKAVKSLVDKRGEAAIGGKSLDLGFIPGGLLPHQVAAVSYCLEQTSTLTKLYLGYSSLGAAGARALAEGLRKAAGLIHLDLLLNDIGADGARALGEALCHNQTLQTLDLTGNAIGDEGAGALAAALRQNTSLQTLNLNTSSIGDEGAGALAAGLRQNTSLQDLFLLLNDITDEGAEHLASCLRENKTLQKLWLRSDKLSDHMKKRLSEEFRNRVNVF